MIPCSANTTLVIVSKNTTMMVGINTHLLSKGFLSAINNKTPQEKAIADRRPIGYSVSTKPILSGLKAEIAILKSARAAIQ